MIREGMRKGMLVGVLMMGISLPSALLAAPLTEEAVYALYDVDKLAELQALIAEPLKQGEPVALLGAGALAAKRGDLKTALEFFRKASDRNNARAQLTLGRFYLNGVGGVAARDPAEALKWIRKSYEGGLPEAALDLGMLHAVGQGVDHSPDKAVALYKEAADKGVITAAGLLAESLAPSTDKAQRAIGAAYARLAAERMKGKENRARVEKLGQLMMESVDDAARADADRLLTSLRATVPMARDTRDLQDAKTQN